MNWRGVSGVRNVVGVVVGVVGGVVEGEVSKQQRRARVRLRTEAWLGGGDWGGKGRRNLTGAGASGTLISTGGGTWASHRPAHDA
jgi:hypothetical protein